MKRVWLLLLFILAAAPLAARDVTFDINSPLVVGVGEQFRVEFNANAVATDFTAPDFAGFDVLAGPTESQGQSISIINGSMTKSVSYTITYVLVASKPGKFTIQPATVKVDGKPYSSRALTIEAVNSQQAGGGASGGQGGQAQGGGGQQGGAQVQSSGGSVKISPEDLFVNVAVDRTTVYKGQPIRATLKIYYRVGIINSEDVKFPSFNGFWTQELNFDNTPKQERYNSREYTTQIIKDVLLYPQQSGTLYIEQFNMTAIVLVVTQRPVQSIFDAMMGGGQDQQEVRRHISSKPVAITVKELPAGAPASFNGAVGSFTMETDAPKAPIAANSGGSITVKISGTGNLPLIQAPKFTMPAAFEQYNVKTTESLTPSASGISGYRQFEFPFVARAEGIYDLGTIEFSFFSPEQSRYVTLRSPNIDIETVKDTTGHASTGAGGTVMSAMSKEDLKILGQDIRFIKLGSAGLRSKGGAMMGSWLYFLLLGLLVVGAMGAYIYIGRRIKMMKDNAFVRGKKANKVALARLRSAERAMKEEDRRSFYEEMLKALWGYIGDKLDIPAAALTRESVREGMTRRNIAPALIDKYIDVISDCEYAQYSPEAKGQMGEAYDVAVDVISKLESEIRK